MKIYRSEFFGRVGLSSIEEVIARTNFHRTARPHMPLRGENVNPIVKLVSTERTDPNKYESTMDGGTILIFADGTQAEVSKHTFNELKQRELES